MHSEQITVLGIQSLGIRSCSGVQSAVYTQESSLQYNQIHFINIHCFTLKYTYTFGRWTSSLAWPISICKTVQVVHINNLICNKTLVLFLVRLYSLIKKSLKESVISKTTLPLQTTAVHSGIFVITGHYQRSYHDFTPTRPSFYRTLPRPTHLLSRQVTIHCLHASFPFQPKSTQPKAFATTKSFSHMSSGKLTLIPTCW